MKVLFRRGFLDLTLLFIIVVIALGVLFVTGFKSKLPQGTDTFTPEIPPASDEERQSLQLNTLKSRKVAVGCEENPLNKEPEVLFASDPAFGGVAIPGGQIRVWVWDDDGSGGSISQGTVVDKTTGVITTPGNRTVADRAGYLWEPAIYLTKIASPGDPGPYAGDKENGGTPYFPTSLKGVANQRPSGGDLTSATIDPPVNIIVNRVARNWILSEFIWDVNSLGLTTGYYRAQIILHDGDTHLSINCTTIQV